LKRKLKINFAGFWPGFKAEDNFFIRTLHKRFEVTLSPRPELLFFSMYSDDHLRYSCRKIQYLPENIRPDFTQADFAISFDYLDDHRHLRLPLYVMYFDEEYTVERLLRKKTDSECKDILTSKKHFCAFVVSNAKADERINFFHKLSAYKTVHSGGAVLNNIGRKIENKLNFIRDYKFVIAFENASWPGYTTEKVLEPVQADSIPVYWGNPLVHLEMNTESFVNYHDYNSFDRLVERVIELDQNDDLYLSMLKQPLFRNHTPNEYFNEERLLNFIEYACNSPVKTVSSGISFKKKQYSFIVKNTFKKLTR
jgi:alpha(1,3/1,4) fucosyltransferase